MNISFNGSSRVSLQKIPSFWIVLAVSTFSYYINIEIFRWVSLLHEIGHFAVGWLTFNPTIILSTTLSQPTYDTTIVRLGGFIAWWVFTYLGFRSRMPVLVGLAIVVALDSLSRIQYQTDIRSVAMIPAYVTIELSLAVAGVVNGRADAKERRDGKGRLSKAEQPRARSARGRDSQSSKWIEEAIYGADSRH